MSHIIDAHSKYALPKLKTAASGQKKRQRMVVGGLVVLFLWVGGLGAVAYSRHSDAQAATALALASQAQQLESLKAAQAAKIKLDVAPLVVAQAPSAPLPSASVTPAVIKHHSASKGASRKHHHSAKRTYAARSTVSAKATGASSAPSAKRMKDDQLDALLKQFK